MVCRRTTRVRPPRQPKRSANASRSCCGSRLSRMSAAPTPPLSLSSRESTAMRDRQRPSRGPASADKGASATASRPKVSKPLSMGASPHASPRSAERDLDDLVRFGAARRIHLDAVALLLADERARDRRGDRDTAGMHIGLGFTDDLVDLLLFGVLVDECHGGPELDRRAVQFADVDDLGARDQALQLEDAALVHALLFLGGM